MTFPNVSNVYYVADTEVSPLLVDLTSASQQLSELGAVMTPILMVRKLRCKSEVTCL